MHLLRKKYLSLFIIVGYIMYVITGAFNVAADSSIYMDKQSQLKYLLYSEDASTSFYDLSGHWAEQDIKALNYMDILKGMPDGTMQPNKTITRAEFVVMLARAIDLPITDTYPSYYKDVDISSWFYYHVSAAKRAGLLDTFNSSSFYPAKVITREEMAVIAAKVSAEIPTSIAAKKFKDIDENYLYYDDINKVASLGIIKGLPDGSFSPNGNASRAEAAVIIQRILNLRYSAQESEDSILVNTAVNYENNIIKDSNTNNYSFQKPLSMSTGNERNMNMIRIQEIRNLADSNQIITKTISNATANIVNKTIYLAEVQMDYDLAVEAGGISIGYKISKNIYLKRKDNRWVIYNIDPSYKVTSSSGGSNDNHINLGWDYYYSSTPDMWGTSAIKGLNVLSPTWFSLTSGSGDIKSIANSNYTDWAHNNGYKVWALVTNSFDKSMTSQMLNNNAARAKFINSLMDYAETLHLDGINVDFENMYTSDKEIFTQFVSELYDKAQAKGLTISVDVMIINPYSSWALCYDRAALSEVADYIMVMTYDQHWSGSTESGSVAQLSWVEDSVKAILNEVPSKKLVLGLPFYTRVWKEVYVSSSSQPRVTSSAITMATAEKLIADNNAAKVWDEQSGQYYAEYKKDGATYKIWLEDEKSIGMKAQLVDKYDLAGVASWRLGYEKPEVWDALYEALY